MEEFSPFWFALGGFVLLLMGYRAVRKKRIMGSSGSERGPRDPGFYLRVGGFWMAGLLLMVFAAMTFHQQYGWGSAAVYVLLLGLMIWIMLRFRSVRRGLGLATVSLLQPKKRRTKAQAQVASPKAWAITAAALPGYLRGLDATTLAGRKVTDANQRRAQKWLKAVWEVDDAAELEEVQEWLIETGHRIEFFDEIQRFQAFTPELREAYLARLESGEEPVESDQEREEIKARINLVEQKGQSLTDTGFLAWDYIRYIDNYRAGYLAGYVEEEDAWDAILSVSQILQSRYDSWEECAEAFLMAREYWSSVEVEKDGELWQKAYSRLRDHPQSPWRKLPWEMPLYQR